MCGLAPPAISSDQALSQIVREHRPGHKLGLGLGGGRTSVPLCMCGVGTCTVVDQCPASSRSWRGQHLGCLVWRETQEPHPLGPRPQEDPSSPGWEVG